MGQRDTPDELTARLRELPSVTRLASAIADGGALGAPGASGVPDPGALSAARRAIELRRDRLRAGHEDDVALEDLARTLLQDARRPSLRRVINATGVIVHTNLGRAPLAKQARDAVTRAAEGYLNLEIDLAGGRRGSRQDHVESTLRELTGAEAAMAVNNGAAAVLLAVAAFGGAGRSCVVSRGQLIEIGGSFRIPDVVAASGTRLVEVGTTNRTRVEDYARAVSGPGVPPVGAILRAHPSNFRTLGFVAEVEIEALCELGVPVIDDVGSGVLAEGIDELGGEPAVRRSVRAGAALVCFSADKLLGGPQAGLLVGRADAIEVARRHPLARAVRIDKLSLAALEATLALYREPARALAEIPVLAMLTSERSVLEGRARALLDALDSLPARCVLAQATSRVGGGSLPLLELSGPVVAIEADALSADALAAALRQGDLPVMARISEGRVLLDPRTLTDQEVADVAAGVRRALAR
jgi:L-seryl-tRNA(Ser) seleniumtransferase